MVYSKQLVQCREAEQLLSKLYVLMAEDKQREDTFKKERDPEDVRHSKRLNVIDGAALSIHPKQGTLRIIGTAVFK